MCYAQEWNPFSHLTAQQPRRDDVSTHKLDDLETLEDARGRRTKDNADPQSSAVMPYEEPICLAHDSRELLRWCHYLHAFGFRCDDSVLEDMSVASPTASIITDADVRQKQESSEHENWKQRFESLDKFREQLKNASIEATSINEIIDSIESDDVGEWINLAASNAGAKIVGANQEARHPLRVIDGKKDTFMKSDCKADQWFIVELSRTAKVKMIEMTMKELYSPRVARVKVYGRLSSVSKNLTGYPVNFEGSQWQFLTELKPENRKGTQHFTVISKGRVKYVGIRIVAYHGMGTACTINDISVYGLSPANHLETLLGEAVHDEGSTQDSPTKTSESKDPESVAPVGSEMHLPTSADKDTHRENKLPEEADPSLVAMLQIEQNDESHTRVSSEDRQRESDEESLVKKVVARNGDTAASLSTFRKMHQDVQTLKGSTDVLSQYVDELRGGLMQTIDELWKAQKTTKSNTDLLTDQMKHLTATLEKLQDRIEVVQVEQNQSIWRAQITMGVIGFCVSLFGLMALKSSSFAKQSNLLIIVVLLLCCLNFAVSFLNLATVFSPTLLIKISKLKSILKLSWNPLLSR